MSITEEYQLRDILAVILGAIETNKLDLAKQTVFKACTWLESIKRGGAFAAPSTN